MSKDYFNDVANQWDELRKSLFPDRIRDAAIEAAGVRPGDTAADLGAGTGFVTEALLAAGLSVIAVDQSQAMLDEMKTKFAGQPVTFFLGDAQTLDIADNTVDFVFANMFLHHVENPSAMLKEAARILKPGGKLVITDMDEHTFTFLQTEQFDRWLGFQRFDIRKWFADAGLSHITVRNLEDS